MIKKIIKIKNRTKLYKEYKNKKTRYIGKANLSGLPTYVKDLELYKAQAGV